MKRTDERWLRVPLACTLFAEWSRVRGGRLKGTTEPFSRSWHELLVKAGLRNADAQREAEADAREMHTTGLVEVKSEKGREHVIRRIVIPLPAEERWHTIFNAASPQELQARARAVLDQFRSEAHPILGELWKRWCESLLARLGDGKSLHPLRWRDADSMRRDLRLVYALTSRKWPHPTPVRTASTDIGLESKVLETAQGRLETLLSQLVGHEVTFESIGLVDRSPLLRMAGPAALLYADGTMTSLDTLRGVFALSEFDLERATSITTTAQRLLTVENEKTTFHQLAACGDRSTLIVAGGAPTTALCLLMRKLHTNLPCWHFGDTDPAGFDILRALRSETRREIASFQMHFRPAADSPELTPDEKSAIARLLTAELEDAEREALKEMSASDRKGLYEQESLGPPTLKQWPFYPCDQSALLGVENTPRASYFPMTTRTRG